jgi:hypothetical protein
MYFLARFGGSVSVVADRVPADTSGSDCCGNPCSSVDPRTSAAKYHRRIEYHYEKFRNSIGRFYESPGTNVIELGNNKERQEDPAVDRASVIGTSFEVRSFLSLVTRRTRCTMLVAAMSGSAGSEVKSSSVEVRQRARSGGDSAEEQLRRSPGFRNQEAMFGGRQLSFKSVNQNVRVEIQHSSELRSTECRPRF